MITMTAQLTPEQAVAEMGRGINLGNTLEPPFENSWNNGPAQESYFDAYVEAGFTNVRVPVRWDRHTDNTPPYAIDESWMDRVEQVIDWGLERDLYITLNGHHEDWLKNGYNNANLRDRYDAIWEQIVERFGNKSEKLLFEIINEPNGMTVAQVDDLNARILGIIREANPTRLVIYSGNMYSNAEQLIAAAIPEDDYIIGYYHSYDPWNFSGLSQGTWGTANDYQQLNARFALVKSWSEANGIPVHYSEFGAMRTADYNSRMRIYAHYTERAVASGFALSVWDDGGDFRMLERGTNTWPETKDIVVHYYEDSPTGIVSEAVLDPTTEEQQVVVTWQNRSTADSDIILERSTNNGPYETIATVPAGTATYTDPQVVVGTTYTYRMYTHREDGTLLHGYPTRLSLNTTVQGPYQDNVQAIPGTVEAEYYDEGGEGVAYHDMDAINQGGNFRAGEGVDIGGDAVGGYLLGYVENSEWIEYTIDVQEAGVYSIEAIVASEIPNGRFSLTFSGNNAAVSFDTPSTGGWVAFETISANSNVTLQAGQQIMRLDIIGNNPFNLDHLSFTNTTSSKDLSNVESLIAVYPNPTADVLNIEYDYESMGVLNVKLFDAVGKVVVHKQLEHPSLRIDIQHLLAGSYTLVLDNEHGQIVKAISKL